MLIFHYDSKTYGISNKLTQPIAYAGYLIMIIFDLQCKNKHTFEGWFEDSHAFKDQCKKGLITCPVCENNSIIKMPSTFAIKKPPLSQNSVDNQNQLMALGKAINSYIENNFDNVGSDFAKEALKMQCGATENRNIRGFSSEQDEKILKEEGIRFFKFPALNPDNDTDT